MNTIKIKHWSEIPDDYTGIIEWSNGDNWWYKNGKFHREDGPAKIWNNGYKSWYLDSRYIWTSNWDKFDLKNHIVLSKEQHPEYSGVQVWKYLNKNEIKERIIIPGMEEYIIQ